MRSRHAVLYFSLIALLALLVPSTALASSKRIAYQQNGPFVLGGVSNGLAVGMTVTTKYVQYVGNVAATSTIFGIDVSTGASFTIDTAAGWATRPAISGRKVVWIDASAGASHEQLVCYELDTHVRTVIASGKLRSEAPRIDGTTVVWTELVGTNDVAIRGADLSTGATFTVTPGGITREYYQWVQPSVSNGWVVYIDSHRGDAKENVEAYRISTGKTYQLSIVPGIVQEPQVGPNGLVVWTVQTGNTMRLWTSNVLDRHTKLLTNNPGYYGEPTLDGNIVICHSEDNGEVNGCRIVGFDLDTGAKFGIAPTADDLDGFAGVGGQGVAWLQDDIAEFRGPNPNLYPGVFTLYVAQPTQIGTFSAPDPFASAVAQSQSDFPTGTPRAVIANGDIWNDVVVGAGLAGDDAPLLLTHRSSLPGAALAELKRLAPAEVQIVGDSASVSDAVVAQIVSALPTSTVVQRLGGGSAEDAALFALESVSASATRRAAMHLASAIPSFSGTVLVCSASDKVSSGLALPVARGAHIPIVFAGKSLSARSLSRLRNAGVKHAVVLGGPKGVSAGAAKQLARLLGASSVVRLAGSDSYGTSALLAEYAVRHWGLTLDGVGIATNAATPDLLLAGLKNGHRRGLLLLTGTNALAKSAAGELKRRHASIRRALYVGRGKRLVGRSVRKAVRLIVR